MQDLVLIGAPARLGGANLGTVAVIAPTRIQYQEMIQAVRYIARLSERILDVPGELGTTSRRSATGCGRLTQATNDRARRSRRAAAEFIIE